VGGPVEGELPPEAGGTIEIQSVLLVAAQLQDVWTAKLLDPPEAGSVADAG
jgi:hypothetical protein